MQAVRHKEKQKSYAVCEELLICLTWIRKTNQITYHNSSAVTTKWVLQKPLSSLVKIIIYNTIHLKAGRLIGL